MAKLKLPSFADGSLLQRTLLYVVTFVVGSAGFLAIASLIVVSAAKALVPARNTDSSASATDKAAAEIAPTTATGKPSTKRDRPSKVKTPVEADATAAEDTH
jgi:hypothetical protein